VGSKVGEAMGLLVGAGETVGLGEGGGVGVGLNVIVGIPVGLFVDLSWVAAGGLVDISWAAAGGFEAFSAAKVEILSFRFFRLALAPRIPPRKQINNTIPKPMKMSFFRSILKAPPPPSPSLLLCLEGNCFPSSTSTLSLLPLSEFSKVGFVSSSRRVLSRLVDCLVVGASIMVGLSCEVGYVDAGFSIFFSFGIATSVMCNKDSVGVVFDLFDPLTEGMEQYQF